MKLKVTEKILDYDNKPVVNLDQEGKPNGNLTWRDVIFVALNSMDQQEQMTAEQKAKSYQIVTKAYQTNEPDFTVEERAYIIERIGKFYSPLVYGRAREIFEEKKEEKVKE